jgi:hypothetical protein
MIVEVRAILPVTEAFAASVYARPVDVEQVEFLREPSQILGIAAVTASEIKHCRPDAPNLAAWIDVVLDNVGLQLKPSGIFTLGTDWTF